MYGVVDIEYIRKKHYKEGWSIRRIAKQLGVSRQTVRKALKDSGPWHYALKSARPSPVMDRYRDVIAAWLSRDTDAPPKQKHTAKKIYDRLCEEYGFTGAECTVRRYVARLRTELGDPPVPVMLLEAEPGEMAQVDWGKAKVKIGGVLQEAHLFCLRMRNSAVCYAWASPHERMEAFLQGHVNAFEWLGGAPEKIVYDNLSTAVKRVLFGHEREVTEQFLALRSHYLFESVFCNTDSANEKGSVENLVGYVRRNALVPVPEVETIDQLNQILATWCERDKAKRQWQADLASLRVLPDSEFNACSRHPVLVSKLSLVTFQRNRYSVPNECIGSVVRIDAYTDRLQIWHKECLVAEHSRFTGRNHTSLKLEHYLRAISMKPYSVNHASVVRQLPEPYKQARRMLCDQNPNGYREMARLLMLHRDFPAAAVGQVISEAVASGRVAVDEVRQRLLNSTASSRILGSAATSISDLRVPVGNPRRYDDLLEVGV